MLDKRVGNAVLSFVAALAVAGFAIGYSAGAPEMNKSQDGESAGAPQIIAVYFHADWCGYCKQLSDRFRDLRNKFDEADVLYVKLDNTSQSDRRQAAYLAHALGIDAAWSEYGGKTGFVLFVDGRSRRVIEKATHDQSLGRIGETLQAALRRSS